MGYYWNNYCFHYRWTKQTKDGRIVCRAHPEVDLVYNDWGSYYCPKCYVTKKKREIHMYRTRPYRRFKPVRKGSHNNDS